MESFCCCKMAAVSILPLYCSINQRHITAQLFTLISIYIVCSQLSVNTSNMVYPMLL